MVIEKTFDVEHGDGVGGVFVYGWREVREMKM
jgi:hypothetical protein